MSRVTTDNLSNVPPWKRSVIAANPINNILTVTLMHQGFVLLPKIFEKDFKEPVSGVKWSTLPSGTQDGYERREKVVKGKNKSKLK